jgi:hypothetical protein
MFVFTPKCCSRWITDFSTKNNNLLALTFYLMCKKWQIYLPGNAQMPGFCIILSSASGGLGGPQTPRLKGRSLRSLHFPSILKKKILLFKILMKLWPLGHVGHVTYSFINMLFISTGDFWWLVPPTNFVRRHYRKFPFKPILYFR